MENTGWGGVAQELRPTPSEQHCRQQPSRHGRGPWSPAPRRRLPRHGCTWAGGLRARWGGGPHPGVLGLAPQTGVLPVFSLSSSCLPAAPACTWGTRGRHRHGGARAMDTLPGCPSSLEITDGLSCGSPPKPELAERQLPGKVIGSTGAILLSPAGTRKGEAFLGGTRRLAEAVAGFYAGGPTGAGSEEDSCLGITAPPVRASACTQACPRTCAHTNTCASTHVHTGMHAHERACTLGHTRT